MNAKRGGVAISIHWPLLAVLLFIAGLHGTQFWQRLALNQAAQITMSALLADSDLLPSVDKALSGLTAQSCRANWLRGLIMEAPGRDADKEAAWGAAMRCDSKIMPLPYVLAPDSRTLAESAVWEHSDSPEPWFWLAEIRIKELSGETLVQAFGFYRDGRQEAPEEVIELYRKGLRLNPHDSLRWCELGDLLASRDPHAAIEAYLQSYLFFSSV